MKPAQIEQQLKNNKYWALAKKKRDEATPCSKCGQAPPGAEFDLKMAEKYEAIAANTPCKACGASGIEPGTHGRGDCSECLGKGYIKL